MPTIRHVVFNLLAGAKAKGRVPACPIWPPDAFAVAATLATKSGCYAEARYSPVMGKRQFFSEAKVSRTQELGLQWRRLRRVPAQVTALWWTIVKASKLEITDRHGLPRHVKDAIMWLLTIADEAGMGLGFPSENLAPEDFFAAVLEGCYAAWLGNEPNAPLKYLPRSICLTIPPDVLCVQPKTLTTQFGVTLRSFSHHLALLPNDGEVRTEWTPIAASASVDSALSAPLNLLVVPYPYTISGKSFVDSKILEAVRDEERFRFFDVRQTWLEGEWVFDPGRFVDEFLQPLCRVAEREVGPIHGIVLPELALEERMAREIAAMVASMPGMELFVAGTLNTTSAVPQNTAFVAVVRHGRNGVFPWTQGKHHRWCLDRSQVVRYHLGHALAGSRESRWWEHIDVEDRRLSFHLFRPGASLAVLICEDLARVEPVQHVIRSVGPNLVIALLMDAPQLENRWPARYATVLADDPGSSVLTVTSLGMIRRSEGHGDPPSRAIALWKNAGGSPRKLCLPEGAHALALILSARSETQRTLDRRTDNGATQILDLTAVRPVALRPEALPAWVES